MKHGRRPTLKQKTRIAAYGFDPKDYLVVKDSSEDFHVVHKVSGKLEKLKGGFPSGKSSEKI